ncbi:MAG: outer membrane beta-barrel protein [Gemmatimonadaceae bacterium]
MAQHSLLGHMRNIRRLVLAAAAAAATSVAGASSAFAQSSPTPTVFQITPYVGYMVFGDYLKGPVGTSLTNAPGVIYGAQAGIAIAPQLSLIGNLGYTNSDLKVGIPLLGGVSVGHSSMLIYDAGLEYSFGGPKQGGTPINPFVQAGIGAISYNIDEDVIQTNATNLAGNVGVGADFAVGNGLSLRVMAKDYIGKFNFQDATGLGISGETAHNFAFSAGLRLNF